MMNMWWLLCYNRTSNRTTTDAHDDTKNKGSWVGMARNDIGGRYFNENKFTLLRLKPVCALLLGFQKTRFDPMACDYLCRFVASFADKKQATVLASMQLSLIDTFVANSYNHIVEASNAPNMNNCLNFQRATCPHNATHECTRFNATDRSSTTAPASNRTLSRSHDSWSSDPSNGEKRSKYIHIWRVWFNPCFSSITLKNNSCWSLKRRILADIPSVYILQNVKSDFHVKKGVSPNQQTIYFRRRAGCQVGIFNAQIPEIWPYLKWFGMRKCNLACMS